MNIYQVYSDSTSCNWTVDDPIFALLIYHFSVVQDHFVFCQLNFIVLFPLVIKYYHILYIIIVFRLDSDKLVSCFFYCLSQGISHGMYVTHRLGEGGWFFIFDYSSPCILFLLIEIHYTFSISYTVLTGYVYYYCIW